MKRIIIIFLVLILTSICLAEENAFEERLSFKYNDNDKRDPLIPLLDKDGLRPKSELFEKAELPIEINLSGIVWNKDVQFAIINGKIVKENEEVARGLILEKINLESVVLEYGERSTTIYIGGPKKDGK
ncbi:MAG: general secretion pathway protein GspB [Candidatus Gygaella obscura]|nr:general secretion pathway protein GspB [Candidatus Gygaella obscura]